MASNSSTIPTTIERLGYGSTDGCIATGLYREVIEVTANRTLVAEESGALVLLAVASGATVTLPSPQIGMQFDVSVVTSRTSNSYKIITSGATVFMVGSYMAGDATIATSGDVFTGDGSTHVALTFDGDTKGGLVGGLLTFTCRSATQWHVSGDVVGTGTMVTAFATS